MCLGTPLTPPTRLALAAPACFLDFSSRRPSSAAPLTHHLLQLSAAELGPLQTPEKHGPLTTEGGAVTGEHTPELSYPPLFNKTHFGFKSHLSLHRSFSALGSLERTRKRVSIFQRQNKDTKSKSSPMKEPGLETISPFSSLPYFQRMQNFAVYITSQHHFPLWTKQKLLCTLVTQRPGLTPDICQGPCLGSLGAWQAPSSPYPQSLALGVPDCASLCPILGLEVSMERTFWKSPLP